MDGNHVPKSRHLPKRRIGLRIFTFNPFTAVTAIWRFEVITHAAICLTLAYKYF